MAERDFLEVIKKIQNLIPNTTEECDFQRYIENLISSAPYTPPESRYRLWRQLQSILNSQLPSFEEPKEDWQEHIIFIYTDGKEGFQPPSEN